MGNDRRPRWLLAAAAGALAGLSLPPLGWPWLLWPCLAVLWSQAGAAQGVGTGVVWGLAAVLVSHRWLPALHPLDWVGVPGPLSLPVCLKEGASSFRSPGNGLRSRAFPSRSWCAIRGVGPRGSFPLS